MSVSRLTESKARSLPARAPGGRDLPLLFYFSFLIHFASVIYFVNLVCLVCSKDQRERTEWYWWASQPRDLFLLWQLLNQCSFLSICILIQHAHTQPHVCSLVPFTKSGILVWMLFWSLLFSLHVSCDTPSLPSFSSPLFSLCSPSPQYLYISMCACSVSLSDSLRPHGLWPARFLCPWDSAAKNTGADYHFLLQGIFKPRDWTWPSLLCLLHR